MKEQLLCKVTSRTKRQLSVDVNRPIDLTVYVKQLHVPMNHLSPIKIRK